MVTSRGQGWLLLKLAAYLLCDGLAQERHLALYLLFQRSAESVLQLVPLRWRDGFLVGGCHGGGHTGPTSQPFPSGCLLLHCLGLCAESFKGHVGLRLPCRSSLIFSGTSLRPLTKWSFRTSSRGPVVSGELLCHLEKHSQRRNVKVSTPSPCSCLQAKKSARMLDDVLVSPYNLVNSARIIIL